MSRPAEQIVGYIVGSGWRVLERIQTFQGQTGGCFSIGYVVQKSGVHVVVANQTGEEISQIQLRFRGGANSIRNLGVTNIFETKINPSSASDIILEYNDATGSHSTNIDVYIEHNYKGFIRITIQRNGSVTWEDHSTS